MFFFIFLAFSMFFYPFGLFYVFYPFESTRVLPSLLRIDAILPRKGLVTRAMSKRLQKDWARAAEEGPRVLMNLRVDF